MCAGPCEEGEIADQHPVEAFGQYTELRGSNVDRAEEREGNETGKDKSDSTDTHSFVGDTAENSVDPEEVPFRHDVCGCAVRISGNGVVRMAEQFWVEEHEHRIADEEVNEAKQVFQTEVGAEGDSAGARVDSERVGGAILMEGSNVEDGQSGNDKGKQVVKAVAAVERRIVNGETAPDETEELLSDERNDGDKIGDDGESPERHLSVGEYVANEGGNNHDQENEDATNPDEFAGLVGAGIVQSTEYVKVNNDEKQGGAVGMAVSKNHARRHILHDTHNGIKSHVGMTDVVHGEEDTGDDLTDKHDTGQGAKIVRVAQILRCTVHVEMTVQNAQRRNTVNHLHAADFLEHERFDDSKRHGQEEEETQRKKRRAGSNQCVGRMTVSNESPKLACMAFRMGIRKGMCGGKTDEADVEDNGKKGGAQGDRQDAEQAHRRHVPEDECFTKETRERGNTSEGEGDEAEERGVVCIPEHRLCDAVDDKMLE